MKFFLTDLKDGEIHNFEEKLNPQELDLEFCDWKYCESLQITGTIEKNANTVVLRGALVSKIEQMCGRCLTTVQRDLYRPYELFYETKDEIAVEPLDDLRDILILDYPMRFICQENCKGLCPQCGKNLNEGECHCNSKQSDALSQLGKVMNQKRSESCGES